jgi:hypothetical protein
MLFQLFIDNFVLCGIFGGQASLPTITAKSRQTAIAVKSMGEPLGKRPTHTSDGV